MHSLSCSSKKKSEYSRYINRWLQLLESSTIQIPAKASYNSSLPYQFKGQLLLHHSTKLKKRSLQARLPYTIAAKSVNYNHQGTICSYSYRKLIGKGSILIYLGSSKKWHRHQKSLKWVWKVRRLHSSWGKWYRLVSRGIDEIWAQRYTCLGCLRLISLHWHRSRMSAQQVGIEGIHHHLVRGVTAQ